MAKVIEHLARAMGKTLFSIEIIPPTKGSHSIEGLLKGIEPMMELKPPFIDVTYHREEYRMQDLPNGKKKEIKVRKRPGTVGICSAIMHKFRVDPVPHVLCGGFSKDETEDLLIDLNYLGIENLMALQGDAAKPHKTFKPQKDGHGYASDLVKQIKDMNAGKFLHDEIEYDFKPDFCIGGGAYPEKHFNAVSLDSDLAFLKKKVDAGVDYLVTQMFFDNQKYFDFVKRCREIDIHVPIIPGLKVLTTKKQAQVLPEIFYLELPPDFRKAVERAKDNETAKEIGVEWCVQQCKELKGIGVPALHFYTMSKSTTTMAVAKQVF